MSEPVDPDVEEALVVQDFLQTQGWAVELYLWPGKANPPVIDISVYDPRLTPSVIDEDKPGALVAELSNFDRGAHQWGILYKRKDLPDGEDMEIKGPTALDVLQPWLQDVEEGLVESRWGVLAVPPLTRRASKLKARLLR